MTKKKPMILNEFKGYTTNNFITIKYKEREYLTNMRGSGLGMNKLFPKTAEIPMVPDIFDDYADKRVAWIGTKWIGDYCFLSVEVKD